MENRLHRKTIFRTRSVCDLGVEGAGKTTLLDAICMALYHKQFPTTQSKSSLDTLMSYGATDCLAEVEFRVGETHYRAFWSQRRSRYKVDGKLQEPQVELYDLTRGVLLETKLKSKLQTYSSDHRHEF